MCVYMCVCVCVCVYTKMCTPSQRCITPHATTPVIAAGLSRKTQVGDETSEYYRSAGGVFAIRWTAPEGMRELKFSEASDVWAFAIVMVELYSTSQIVTSPPFFKMVPKIP